MFSCARPGALAQGAIERPPGSRNPEKAQHEEQGYEPEEDADECQDSLEAQVGGDRRVRELGARSSVPSPDGYRGWS